MVKNGLYPYPCPVCSGPSFRNYVTHSKDCTCADKKCGHEFNLTNGLKTKKTKTGE